MVVENNAIGVNNVMYNVMISKLQEQKAWVHAILKIMSKSTLIKRLRPNRKRVRNFNDSLYVALNWTNKRL